MSWAAVIAGGAAIIGGVVSSQGARKAANTAASSSDAAINASNHQFDVIQQNTAPYRAIGSQAINALGSIYGYQPSQNYFSSSPMSGASAYQPAPFKDSGFFNSGAGSLLNPYTLTSKLGDARYVFDPAGKLFGNLFGSSHGDEKRNLSAFLKDNQVYDLGNGNLAMADGTTFNQSQLKDIAGTYYGAKYAPDGNQADWQQRYSTLLGGLQKSPQGNAGTGQTSDGVPNSVPMQPGQNALTSPNYSAFFKSPDYTFRQSQGLQGIERSAAARGGAFSGNALKALNEFNSNLAAGGFNDYFNHQAALAGIGQTATSQTNQAGLITANSVGNALQNAGDARASGVAGQYNAWGNALSGLAQGAGYYFGNRGQSRNSDPSGIGYFTPTQRRV
jgi:hypothetical protein